MNKPVLIGPGRIVFSPGQVRLMDDNRFFTNRFILEGNTIEQHNRTREWRCSCSEYQGSNTIVDNRCTCAHLQHLKIPGGHKPYEAKVEIAEGLRLRVLRRRLKVQNERKRLQQAGKLRP
jgi:hypothetical protein